MHAFGNAGHARATDPHALRARHSSPIDGRAHRHEERFVDVVEAIRNRRSVKEFEPEPVRPEDLAALLELAVLAPNHGLTQPWRFYVLGEETKARYGRVRARFKTSGILDEARAARKRDEVVQSTLAVPVVLGVSSYLADDPVTREEDYAAVFMAIQNILLAAPTYGLAGKIHTGRILEDDELRAALEVPREHRLVALVHMGRPREVPAMKARRPAAELTIWLP